MKYSVVVPLYNESENVALLHKKIITALQSLQESFEIIFIDDCSTDNTIEKCKKLSPLVLVVLQKNKGQTAAMDAGIKQAKGEYIITMDGDLQNDPADIPAMIAHLQENNLDVVSGWRKKRNDPFMKRFVSRGAYALRQLLIKDGIHDSGCSLKIYKKSCFDTVDLYGEMHRFIPAILKMKGFRIGEYVVTHHARQFGVTKYNWKRTVKGFLDMISVWFWQKYAGRPLHFLGGIGFTFFIIGFFSSIYALSMRIFVGEDLSETAFTTLALLCFFFGLQFIIMGILFDVLLKVYYNTGKDKSYYIKNVYIFE